MKFASSLSSLALLTASFGSPRVALAHLDHVEPHSYFHLVTTGGNGLGCAVPRPGTTKIFLDKCKDHPDRRWRAEPIGAKKAIRLVSELDESMCLRAGKGETVQSGTFMRLQPCDVTDELQQFVYDGFRFQLTGRPDLCMVYRGITPNVGVDPIILKTCNDNQEGWVAPSLVEDAVCEELQCSCETWSNNDCGSSVGPFCSVGIGGGSCVCFSPAKGVGSVCAEISSDWDTLWLNGCTHDGDCASDEKCGYNPCGDRNHCMRLCDKMMRPLKLLRVEMRNEGSCEAVPCA